MIRRYQSTILLLLSFLFFSLPLLLQSQDTHPEITPAYIAPLHGENAPTQYAYRNLVIDQTGRLWLKTIGVAEQIYALQVFQFDGYNHWFVDVARENWKDVNIRAGYLEDFNTNGLLYGYLNDPFQQSTLYTFEVETNNIQYTPMPEGMVGSMEEYEPGKFWVLEKTKNTFNIHHWDGKELCFYFSIPNHSHYREPKGFLKHADTDFRYVDSTLWILDADFPLIAFEIASKTVKRYDGSNFPDFVEKPVTLNENRNAHKEFEIRGDSLYLVHNLVGKQFYIMERKGQDQLFFPLNIVPENARAHSIWKDKQNNLLFLYEYIKPDRYKMGATLLDSYNNLYDYSPMVESIPRIRSVSANNFKRQAYFGTNTGAYVVQARSKKAITTYEELVSLRHIRQIGTDEFLVRTQRDWLRIIKNGAIFNIPENSCLSDPSDFQGNITLLTDPQGKVWLKGISRMTRYNPRTDGNCISYTFDTKIKSAAFLSDKKLALIEEETNQLVIYDLQAQKSESISGLAPLKGVPHYMHVTSDNVLWIATNKGLYMVNWLTGQTRYYGDTPGFEDSRILVIHDDQRGRLWLGTVNRGIHVFDIEEEKIVMKIDVTDGLSNNLVVGILEDDDGAIWASTYNGLNLIQSSGESITIFKEEDGLTHNEFNRYSYFKTADGSLFFGTLEGLNVIDPKKVKQALQSSETTKIYISQLSYFDAAEDRVVQIRNYQSGKNSLKLPADKRFLSVRVGASNYGMNTKNRYAYRLKGIDQEWAYMGTEHFIRLPNLPAGKYVLEIIGIDHNGNKSENAIRIPIQAKEFFYKQAWFYILLSMPFLVFALLWILRLNKEKEILEKEVDKRTLQIRKDKELIEQQAMELKQLDQMKSRFFANISHDFRTPLTLITGPAELIQQDVAVPQIPRIRQSLQSILQNGKKLLNLVDEMLDLARIESHQIKLHEQDIALYPLCKSIYTAYQAAAQRKQIYYELNYQLDPDMSLITDPKRLEKILSNLLGNAFKFTTQGETISFNVFSEQAMICFQIKDTGRGIPPEDLPHIFDRYFQSKQEALSISTGSGIGLSLSLELAKLMGGEIVVDSTFGQGSIFTLSLPLKETKPANQPKAITDSIPSDIAAYPQQRKSGGDGPSSTVLVVEDNLEVQDFIKSILSVRYQVITQNNGSEALHFLKKQKQDQELPVDLIVSDINMPKMNGYELLGALKKDHRLQQVPIIILTARTKEKSKLKALRMGVDDYLTKPFSPTELLVRIDNLISNYKKRIAYQKEHYQVAPQFEEATSADQIWLEELEKTMLDALDKKMDLTIPYIANAISISQRQLSRKIKLLTGLTIGKYIQEVKLQKARHLLENQIIKSVAEASYLSGFKSPSHFTKVYQKYYGKNPSVHL